MSGLYNVDLEKRTGIEQRTVGRDLPLEEFITALRAAAEGLTEVTVEVDHEQYYDSCEYSIIVSGYRPLTDAEVAEEERRREVNRARRDLYAEAEMRLLARFSEPTGRFSIADPRDQRLPRRDPHA